MNSNILLPTYFKKIGLFFFIPFAILGCFVIFKDFEFSFLDFNNFHSYPSDNIVGNLENFTNELAIIGTLISLFFIAFSREKNEDEFIFKTRLESLLWATYINIFLMVVITLAFYSMNYSIVITNMIFILLLVFIFRFNFILYWKSGFENGEGGNHEK
jgi:FlaA1/EpsC-like NDP-sugar epimerase